MKTLIFVFDRIPDNEGCNFIEVENESGESVCAGEWRSRDDGLAELVVPVSYGTQADTADADLARKDGVIEDLIQSNSDMVTCLAATEQRVSELVELLREVQPCVSTQANGVKSALRSKIDTTLNPNPEAGSHE